MSIRETSVTQYKLKVFQSSSDSDFVSSMKLYADNIGTSSLTSTSEIAYCIDNYNTLFSDAKFIAAGFYQNKLLAGYCQFVYMTDEKLIIIDYLVIDKKFRGLNTFYTFIEKIKEFVESNNFSVRFLIGEINIQHNTSQSIPQKGLTLIRLLKANNFGVIKNEYYQPMLGIANFESVQRSILMLYPYDQYGTLKKETYLSIIECIYFKHYERWYRLFFNESQIIKYTQHLHELNEKIKASIEKESMISLEGYNDIFGESEPFTPKVRKIKNAAILSIGFTILLSGLVIIALLSKRYLHIEFQDQLYFLIAAASLYLIFLSLFLDSASKLVNKIFDKLSSKIIG